MNTTDTGGIKKTPQCNNRCKKLLEFWRHGSGYFILSYMVHTAAISGFKCVCTTGDNLCAVREFAGGRTHELSVLDR